MFFFFISGYGEHTVFQMLSNILVPIVFASITPPGRDPSELGLKEHRAVPLS